VPTLTADQKTDLRQLTGMECTPYDIADTVVQTLYDRAYALGEDTLTTEAITVVSILERLWGQARIKVDQNGELQTEMRSQYFLNIEKMLKRWEAKAGMSGGIISAGTISLGLDQDEETNE
jgi:hypothetical protein